MIIQDLLTQYLPQIVFYASIVSASLPEPRPDSFGAVFKNIINVLALNVFNAQNRPGNTPQKPPNITPVLIFACLTAMALPSWAESLTWTQPTTRVNDTPYNAATENSAVKVYRTGTSAAQNAVYTLPPTATAYPIPPDCSAPSYAWAVTVVDKTPAPVGPLESPLSDVINTSIDKVGCAPKKLSVQLKTGP